MAHVLRERAEDRGLGRREQVDSDVCGHAPPWHADATWQPSFEIYRSYRLMLDKWRVLFDIGTAKPALQPRKKLLEEFY